MLIYIYVCDSLKVWQISGDVKNKRNGGSHEVDEIDDNTLIYIYVRLLFIYLFVCLFIYLFICFFVCLFNYLFIYSLFLLYYWNLDGSVPLKGSHLDR